MLIKRTMLATAIVAAASATAQADLLISEYIEGSGNNKALELFNPSLQTIDLTAWELQIYFNGNTNPGLTIDLQGSIAPGNTFVFASAQADPAILAVADQTSGAGLFNGDDAITLLRGGVVVDSIGQIGVDPGSYWGSGDIRTADRTLRRREGTLADSNPFDSYEPAAYFDGFPINSFDDLGRYGAQTPNEPEPEPDPDTADMTCGAPSTLISSIQGSGHASPVAGENHVVEAIVSAVFTGSDQLGGFYVEEALADRDDNDATSEGLFIYSPGRAVTVGQRLRMAGTVTEFNGLTQLASLSDVADCGTAELPPPVVLSLPWATADAPEAYESMRVRFAEPLVVNDTYDLGRFGSLTLGSDRHFIPTNIATPGTDAALVAELQQLDRLILDDGSNRQNPAIVPYPTPELSATHTVRAGDQVHDLSGILDYRFDEWRLHPVTAPSFQATNPRTPEPELADRGNLVVASFNVLNYFNGDGMGGGFPTARGANNPEELSRQTAKLVSAIRALNADIVGLMEIENDGYGEYSAIASLAAELGPEWSYVDPGLEQLGSDAIAVGFIYRTDRVDLVGEAATLSQAPFDNLNRQPLTQTFRPRAVDDTLTITVNHFKSKGCGGAVGAEADQGDGQSCWNPTRTQAAIALANWLANNPTGAADGDHLIIGDLNAYAKEDPIQALAQAGYTDLLARFVGEQAYTYVFFGQAGYLDHALASESLLPKVTDTTVWRINADEPRALDYNLEFKNPQQQASYFAPDAYRSSDHDPVIVALKLGTASPTPLPGDLNGDGRVDGRDLAKFLLALIFGKANTAEYDLNGDGKVNGKDMKVLIGLLSNR